MPWSESMCLKKVDHGLLALPWGSYSLTHRTVSLPTIISERGGRKPFSTLSGKGCGVEKLPSPTGLSLRWSFSASGTLPAAPARPSLLAVYCSEAPRYLL